MSKRKGRHARRCPIFRPKTSEEQKKGHHAPDCSLYEYYLYLVHSSAGGGRTKRTPGYAPAIIEDIAFGEREQEQCLLFLALA